MALAEPVSERQRLSALAVIGLTLALVYGIWYSYGVIMVALLAEFGWSRSLLAGAFSLFTLVHGIANPVVGWLCARMEPPRLVAGGAIALAAALSIDSLIATPWHLYVAFGLCTALAVSASGWVPALVQVQRRFPDRLGLALGIVSSGVGVGMLFIVPLCQLLIDAFGWRWAFRGLALIGLVWIVPAAIYLIRTAPPRPSPPAQAPDAAAARPAETRSGRALTLRQAMRTTPFWLIVLAFLSGNICAQTLHVHQVPYLVDQGLSALVAASVVSVVGASSIVAKIVGGWISDRIDREIVYVVCIAILVGAVGALAWLGQWPSHGGAYLYAAMLGAGYSVTAAVIPAMTSDRFSGPHFGAIVGMGLFASAIGSALGPWFAGWLFDRTGSYAWALVMTAGCGVTAGCAGWMLRRLRLRGADQAG
jgi:MFS family permease